MFDQPNLSVNEEGHLCLAGVDTLALAKKYGTPLYLLDEDMVRERMHLYSSCIDQYFPRGSRIFYASKALCCKEICRWAQEEQLGLDTVSSGEIATALAAGFPPQDICFHGNAKTTQDLCYAMDSGIGLVAVDGEEELEHLSSLALQRGLRQKVLLRVTPGIDPHTFAAVNTGIVDVKFGVPIPTGQALAVTKKALSLPGIQLIGFHCHVGSQIFDATPFRLEVDVMLQFMEQIRQALGYTAEILNLGGGIAVPYESHEIGPDCEAMIANIGRRLQEKCGEYGYPLPAVYLEPGRGIVGAAGITLYTVQNVKRIPGGATYVAVDGGMGDNPRYALYGARHSAAVADRAGETETLRVTLAGRYCESGDLLGENVPLQPVHAGDTVAVFVTGAYNYSMASNYNRVPRPPIAAIRSRQDRLIVRRERLEDLVQYDL